MEEKIQEKSVEAIVPPLLDKAWKRGLFGLFVVAAPIYNFSFVKALKPEWQDGDLSSYIDLFLRPEASLWFFPLLACAVISYILLLWGTERYTKSFIIRMGVYTGLILALQYSVLSIFAINDNVSKYLFILFVYIAPLLVARLHRWLTSKWKPSLINTIFIGLAIVALVAAMILMGDPSSPFILILLFLGVSAPFWCFLVALQASRWSWKYHESRLTLLRGLGIFVWLSAYAFALRFNILKMFELYNALPTEPPCYIATAAAKGHPRFVGTQTIQMSNGKSMHVNRQLQRLKAVEIALMGVSGTGHRWMRSVYDVVGKRLATYIQNPILADVAFVLLIPVEWVSFFALKLVVPEIQDITNRLYHS